METPHTKAGQVTERIMEIFSEFRGDVPPVVKLNTSQYNHIYSRVLETLEREYTEAQ